MAFIFTYSKLAFYGTLATLVAGLLTLVSRWAISSKQKYPPGPVGLPLIGNLFDMPTVDHHLAFSKWAKEFGNVVYVKILRKPILILSSYESTVDLFERRSAYYSDRPHLVMAGELCGMQKIAPLTPYGEPLRKQRRMMNSVLNSTAVKRYEYIQAREIRRLIECILLNPSDFMAHIKRMATSTVFEIIYGYRMKSSDDYIVKLAEDAMDASTHVGNTIWAVDFFPILKFLPGWFPGAGFIKLSKEWRSIMEKSVEIPFSMTKNAIESKNYQSSLVSNMLYPDSSTNFQPNEEEIKWTANSLYIGGADTTTAVISVFCLAMIMHPKVQVKAQREIDSVIGVGRSPTLSDRSSLPYVNAIVAECLRWHVPVPIAPPHELTKDDNYLGFHLPKGSVCLANTWWEAQEFNIMPASDHIFRAMLRDEEIYPKPDDFYPERFEEEIDPKTKAIRDPKNIVFGFGRRRCPGIHLAESTIWLSIATLLALVTISNEKDIEGNDIIPTPEFTSEVIRRPLPFACKFEMRKNSAIDSM